MTIKRMGAGNRMSKAVIHGGKVYLAGMVAEKTVGKSVKEQTKDILGQIDDLLKQAGSDKTKILKANIWLTDMKTFAEMNEAWDAWVKPGARTFARHDEKEPVAAVIGSARHGRIEARRPRPRYRDHGRGGDLDRHESAGSGRRHRRDHDRL